MSGQTTAREAARIGTRAVRGATASRIAVEEPLQVQVDCNPIAVTMRTPGNDRALAVGFLYSEGILDDIGQIERVVISSRRSDASWELSLANVLPKPGCSLEVVQLLELRRGTLTTSACGVCGRQMIDDLLARCRPLRDGPTIPVGFLVELPRRLTAHQRVFSLTGGVHAAAVYSAAGELLACFEDVGRHNAVDKAIGSLVLEGLIPARSEGAEEPTVLCVSGRASFEIVQKAAVARLPVVASVSAPSSLAIDLAKASNMTLAAFVRDGSAEVFAGIERIV